MFKTFQNCFFIVQLQITASDLIEYLETLMPENFDHRR